MMIVKRIFLPSNNTLFRRNLSKTVSARLVGNATDQVDYIKSVLDGEVTDWSGVKSKVLNKWGDLNEKNIDGVMLKVMVNYKKFEAAVSFASHLKSRTNELSLGSINGLLHLYYEMGQNGKLSDGEKAFILETYKYLYDKYKYLESTTSERLLHALCVIDEWKKALKVLDDICISSIPSHSAYSTLIGTLFKNNRNREALDLIDISVSNRRHLKDIAYKEWIDYILRNNKDKMTIFRNLDEIFWHIARNSVVISDVTAAKIKDVYTSLGSNVYYTKIRKWNGQCMSCKSSLEHLKLSEEEFQSLQNNVKEKLIVGSDLFLKTSPEELKRFTNFIEKTAPYDVILDTLNIAYSVGNRYKIDKLGIVTAVVDHFLKDNKKILILGRKHMLSWSKKPMQYLMSKTCSFFTDDLSQDDPYFIAAAILSGPHTDIVSKDLLRGHKFLLKDENLRFMFLKWQWMHQWKVYISSNQKPRIQAPLTFTPCAQKNPVGWHLPYQREDASTAGQLHDGVPDFSSWLCIKNKYIV